MVIEGIDGSGKGTQSRLIKDWLEERGHQVLFTQEPTDGEVGRLLRKKLLEGDLAPETEALLFAADRREHQSEITMALSKGSIVICDRYLPSSLAYQGARGVNLDWIREINRFARIPDRVFLLDLEPEKALERINNRLRKLDYFEKTEFLKKVRNIYLELDDMIVVDASKPEEDVFHDLAAVLRAPLD